MEKSLTNSLDELVKEIEDLEDTKRLKILTKKVIEKYKTTNNIKAHKDDFLVQEFLNALEEVENLSILISDIFSKELDINR